MPTGDRRRRLRRALLSNLLAALLAPAFVACSGDEPDDTSEPAPTASRNDVPVDVVAALTRSLDRRAGAVRRGDPQAFTAGLARRPRFTRAQQTYLANLTQLPLGRFSYALDPGSLVREGDDYWVVVELTMQLVGYDDRPVTTPDRFRFSPSPRNPERYLLASVTDREWEARHEFQSQPWDIGPIEVRSGSGVLGVFDPDSVAFADGVLASVERGISNVAGTVPFSWSRSVVVYALSGTAFVSSIDDLPGGDPERLDGVSFPVRTSPDDGRIAAVRFVLSPGMLDRPGIERDRLVRHELTHVALGERDDRVPVWLSEGLAEYVSVRPLAPQDRLISGAAVTSAKTGVRGLPDDETFNGPESSVHYAMSWWACEYLADSFGESTLWTLLDVMGEQDADPDQVLRDQFGIGEHELARQAAKLIVLTFDPESLEPTKSPSPGPSETPSDDPSESPSPEPSESPSAGPSGSPSGSPTP